MARIQRKLPSARRANQRAEAGGGSGKRQAKRKVPLKHLVRFSRLLATLTQAGLPVLRNLHVLAGQWPEGKFRDTIEDTAALVEEGQPLSDALAQHPEVFDDLFVNMARAGEAGGVLDQVLERLAGFMERAQGLRDRTRSAVAYPAVIMVVAVIVVGVLMTAVIPKFDELFREMDLTLPPPTEILIGLSGFLSTHWYVLFLPFVFFGIWQLCYLRSHGFRHWNHRVWLRLPMVGGLIRTGQISRFSTTFGTLVTSGVPHLQAFEIVRGALTNEVYRDAIDDITDEVREGEAIAAAMEATACFDDVVVSMVEVGEETGDLDRMCLRVGESYEENYNRVLDITLKMLEPLLLVLMAAVVGMIAISLFLPLFKLLAEFGQQA